MKYGFPRVLTSRIALPAGLVGNVPFDSGLLQSPDREDFAVHEIRFTADLGATAAPEARGTVLPSNFGANFQFTDAGPFLRVAMRVGPYRICDFIPMWALSASRDFCMEANVWRLPLAKPLFIPAGMGFFAAAQRITMTVGGIALSEPEPFVGHTVFVSCSLIGRVVTADLPRTTTVPYISAYAPDAEVQGVPFLSPQGTLENDLRVPLKLQYGLGRVAHLRHSVAQQTQLYVFPNSNMNVSMLCQLRYENQMIIDTNSEFLVAFDPSTNVLNLGGQVLPPGGRLTFRSGAPTPTNLLTMAAEGWAPVVSIIGDRKEGV